MFTPDPALPEGAAIIDLAARMQELQDQAGEWPGADTVSILEAWLGGFDFASPVARSRQVAASTWVLRRQDRHEDRVTLWADQRSALAELAEHVRSCWDNVCDYDGVPDRPPLDDRAAIDLYYGPEGHRGDESYTLYGEDIGRLVRTPSRRADAPFPDRATCSHLNRRAAFHAPAGPCDRGLPCIETAGILVFAYLDPSMQAVRVSVHLDSADEVVVQPGDWVPLHIEVEGSTVYSAGAGVPRVRPRQRGRWARWLRGGLTHPKKLLL
ncbi:hypothetical protein [Streptomyces sp. NPDC094468]|uniref:hypothetical protein n=1 Tax=Streptomyces sp. NPDC094468 TaxID=3366066 RepID=UPI0037FDE1D0